VALADWAEVESVAVAGDVAGVCANEVAIKNANRIVINDIKVFMAAFCQQSANCDKCETS
ncbi:MAG: hypothetical protein ACJ8KC_11585, partial [Candidatus Udaeobacter sp.]